MRKGSFLLFLVLPSLFVGITGDAQSPVSPIPADESFIDQVYHTIVDSAATSYYLCEEAAPCSFVRYDYDEWLKYDLQETVPIYILNELAKNSYYDRKSCTWQQDRLVGAVCIGRTKCDSLLDPVLGLQTDSGRLSRKEKKLIARKWADWSCLPVVSHTVYYFSRPVFTDDGQYAILDMDQRCDDRQCGQGSTCLFRHTEAGWKLIGRRLRWGT